MEIFKTEAECLSGGALAFEIIPGTRTDGAREQKACRAGEPKA
jgi:hypothetical protein